MANEALSIACAANRDVPATCPGPFQDCSDVVHLSVFFDGTGNNKDADEIPKKWSNVARMWRSALARAANSPSTYPIYVSGLGTKFNGNATGWVDKQVIWVQDGMPGSGAGSGGDRRMEFGHDNVNDRLRQVLIDNAGKLGGVIASYAKANSTTAFSEINKKLGQHRLIKVINLSVFGFSRGAALARAFVNRVVSHCQREGNELRYEGYPLRLTFLGLFDTVASFGLPAQNVRLPWDERDLIVPKDVERCVHYVAAHELRYSFPVDLISQGAHLAGAWVETLYPGVHSDVGGGYEPDEQGISNNYARIPMRDMMGEAVLHGVRMLSYAQLSSPSFAALFKERYECLPATEAAYKAYQAAAPSGGDIRSQRIAHMKLLYSAYGTLYRQGQQTATQRQKADSMAKRVLGPLSMAEEANLHRLLQRNEYLRNSSEGNSLAQYVKAQPWQLAAWDTNGRDGVVDFVARFVHDSKVDFLSNIEPFSYFRLRTMQESTRSIWNETGDWVTARGEEAAALAKQTAHQVLHTADELAQAAQEKARQARDAADRAYRYASDRAAEAYDAAKHKTREAYEAGKRQAHDAYEAAQAAAISAEKDAAATLRSGKRLVESGITWVERKVDQAQHAIDEAAQSARRRVGR